MYIIILSVFLACVYVLHRFFTVGYGKTIIEERKKINDAIAEANKYGDVKPIDGNFRLSPYDTIITDTNN